MSIIILFKYNIISINLILYFSYKHTRFHLFTFFFFFYHITVFFSTHNTLYVRHALHDVFIMNGSSRSSSYFVNDMRMSLISNIKISTH